jgi:hypothetical protein
MTLQVPREAAPAKKRPLRIQLMEAYRTPLTSPTRTVVIVVSPYGQPRRRPYLSLHSRSKLLSGRGNAASKPS